MMAKKHRGFISKFFERIFVLTISVALTVALFLVLPLLQAITSTPPPDLMVSGMTTTDLPPPPPPPEEEKREEEKPPEEKPPELKEMTQPLDLSALELALNPGSGGDGFGGMDVGVHLGSTARSDESGKEADELFSLADLDQRPRVVHQPTPMMSPDARKRAPGSVTVLFIVDQDGRVENPIIQSSSDPVFERATLAAVKQWKFEPGKQNGKPVKFRMRVPVTFPKS